MEQEKERLREELEAEKRELEEEEAAVQQGIEPDEGEEEHKDPALERQKRIEKQKRKEEILEIKKKFLDKLISPFTPLEELEQIFMRPVPKEVGTLECSIHRNKGGFNMFHPKYTLTLSEGERFLLNGKKRGGNKTSNYMVTMD